MMLTIAGRMHPQAGPSLPAGAGCAAKTSPDDEDRLRYEAAPTGNRIAIPVGRNSASPFWRLPGASSGSIRWY